MARSRARLAGPIVALLLLSISPWLHASFIIDYVDSSGIGFNDGTYGIQRKTAFEWAVAQWDGWLCGADPVPIRIETSWADLASGTLASTYSSQYVWKDFSGAPVANTWYPDALADSLFGSDLYYGLTGSTSWDMRLVFNTDYTTWNYDYTLNDGEFTGLFDFATVSMHEVGHGMGLFSTFKADGSWGYGGLPLIYDTFLEYGDGTDLISSQPASSVTSPTYWNGAKATTANGGSRVQIYAPGTWQPGSSLSHIDGGPFPNYLMNFSIGPNDERRNIDPIMSSMLFDVGWEVPEPGTGLLMGFGLAGVLIAWRRRKPS